MAARQCVAFVLLRDVPKADAPASLSVAGAAMPPRGRRCGIGAEASSLLWRGVLAAQRFAGSLGDVLPLRGILVQLAERHAPVLVGGAVVLAGLGNAKTF